ncbi:MAG TPA: hypothetical protein DCX07_14290 [Phycisphaerales bacterium]|nr:hypothetical protein [Phycisphaerales bacterium]
MNVGPTPPGTLPPLPRTATGWPTVVGVLCMVLGGLGLTGMMWNVLASSEQMTDPFGLRDWSERETRRLEDEPPMTSQPSEDIEIDWPDGKKTRVSFPKPEPVTIEVEEDPSPQQMEELVRLTNPYHGGSLGSVLLTALAALAKSLLVLGGFLLYRRRPAAKGFLLGTAMFLILESVVSQALMMHGILSFRGFGGKMGEEFFRGILLASQVGGLIFSLAGPVFLLIWFNRRKIVREVESWRTETIAH